MLLRYDVFKKKHMLTLNKNIFCQHRCIVSVWCMYFPRSATERQHSIIDEKSMWRCLTSKCKHCHVEAFYVLISWSFHWDYIQLKPFSYMHYMQVKNEQGFSSEKLRSICLCASGRFLMWISCWTGSCAGLSRSHQQLTTGPDPESGIVGRMWWHHMAGCCVPCWLAGTAHVWMARR